MAQSRPAPRPAPRAGEHRVTFCDYGGAMDRTCPLLLHKAALAALLLAPVLLVAGCSQGPSDSAADLQQRLTAAEARADAAEKRAKSAETLANQHAQEPAQNPPPAAQPDLAQGADTEYGQPAMDTAPIDPAPAMPADSDQ